jgi:ribosomal protein S11
MNKKEIAKLVDSIYDICEKKGIKTQVELIVNEDGSIDQKIVFIKNKYAFAIQIIAEQLKEIKKEQALDNIAKMLNQLGDL